MALIGTISLLGFVNVAYAYPIGSTSAPTPTAVNLPQLPSGTFNLNWDNFLKTLPIQSFIASLEANGNATVNNSIQTVAPSINGDNGHALLQQIDDWTSVKLGFRFSALFGAVLGIMSWVLGLAKSVVDWLLNFFH